MAEHEKSHKHDEVKKHEFLKSRSKTPTRGGDESPEKKMSENLTKKPSRSRNTIMNFKTLNHKGGNSETTNPQAGSSYFNTQPSSKKAPSHIHSHSHAHAQPHAKPDVPVISEEKEVEHFRLDDFLHNLSIQDQSIIM